MDRSFSFVFHLCNWKKFVSTHEKEHRRGSSRLSRSLADQTIPSSNPWNLAGSYESMSSLPRLSQLSKWNNGAYWSVRAFSASKEGSGKGLLTKEPRLDVLIVLIAGESLSLGANVNV